MKNGKANYNEVVFTEEQLKDIKESYLNGESSVKIGKRYGTSHKPILKALHRMELDVNEKYSSRKYKLNEHYFDNIDTPNKAYILGLLFSDGHNSINKRTVSIALQEEDKEILEKVNIEIGSNRPLEFLDYSNKHDFGYHYKNQYRLAIFCSHIVDVLYDLGMTPNKSLSLKFPTIPYELHSHFIRGYFDGDGTINKKSGTFGMIATYDFALVLNDIIKEHLNTNDARLYESSNHNGINYNIEYNKADSKKIFDWMYNDAELYMQRKYETYCNCWDINIKTYI